ncbi:MAG: SMP-30/gluconolactonase/LRE family protein [Myxococcales bacterium]|nr:SMP-30/gluconolactonase/LRE family protein [Myxococcales bacterium]MCB9708193.1 SMP-30/gluconolactonase/LRE family protein [Myxococcales bacterium]
MTSEGPRISSFATAMIAVMGCASTPPRPAATTQPPENRSTLAPAPAEIPLSTDVRIADVGLKVPESILYDPESDLYLISNIQGSPLDIDNNGFITRMRPDGSIQDLKWIDGERNGSNLSAPKGMAILADTLYVADVDHVRMFDRVTGAVKGQIKVVGATFLNDVAIGPDGTVYLTDSGLKMGTKGLEPSGTDAVYRLAGGRAVKVIKDKTLGNPNGIIADEEGLWVATFGAGSVLRINLKGKVQFDVTFPKGGLDGILRLDSVLLVSSWKAQAIYAVPLSDLGTETSEPPFRAVLMGIHSPADIGFDTKRQRILVPLFEDNAVVFHDYR